jgi:hypothetical protein
MATLTRRQFLLTAAAAGLGVFERWDASQQYQEIDYQRLEVSLDLPNHLYLPLVGREG